MVVAIRKVGDKVPETLSVRYYISSAHLSAKELIEKSRAHWSVEVQLHWRLDVEMNEDACLINRGQAGVKRKQQKAGRNRNYLTRVLMGQGLS